MALPLFALMGGAVDYGNAVSVSSALQAASDAAVLAAASLPADASPDQRAGVAANLFSTNVAAHGVTGATPEIRVEGNSISVSVSANVPTAFLQLMRINTIAVAVSAQSTYTVDSSAKACLLALDPESLNGIHIQGAGRVNYPACWAHTNSLQASAINAAGSNATAIGAGHCAVGGIAAPLGNFSPTPISGCQTISDPFAMVSAYSSSGSYIASFATPAIPSNCAANNLNLKKGSYRLDPGRYCGGLSIQAQASVTFSPGIYIIDNGQFNVQSGANVSGSDVLFYFRGPNASLTIIGGGTVSLTGRSSSSSYSSFLFIADATNWGGVSNIQGGGALNLEGILYMPTQTILVTGNGDVNGSSTYFGMVAKDFSFQGNGQFNLVPHDTNATLTDIMANIPIVTNVRLSH